MIVLRSLRTGRIWKAESPGRVGEPPDFVLGSVLGCARLPSVKACLNSLACLLLGGALVFVMDRIPTARESGKYVDPPPPVQTRSDPKPPSPGEASRRIAIRREEIRKTLNSEDWVKKREFVEGLQSVDVPELLAVMLEDASPEGVDINRRELLSAALANWAGRDIHGALDWAAAHPKEEVRHYLQQELLEMCARNDPFQAVDLALEIQKTDESFGISDIAMRGMEKFCETAGNERKLAALMRKTAVPIKCLFGTSATAAEFAEGFDFKVVLDEMAATEREGLGIRASVLGLLRGWAKKDPDAAHAWFAANGQVGSEDWGGISSWGYPAPAANKARLIGSLTNTGLRMNRCAEE